MQALLCFFFLFFLFFFFHVSVPKGSSASQAFLSKTVETGKKNRILTTFIVCKWVLWWACSLFLTMTKMTPSVDHVLAVWQWCNVSPNWGPWLSCNYTCVLKSKYSEEFSTLDKVGCDLRKYYGRKILFCGASLRFSEYWRNYWNRTVKWIRYCRFTVSGCMFVIDRFFLRCEVALHFINTWDINNLTI